MADISLRDYLAKLDTLLKSGSAAEVILHCRHILQYYPKDAQAYRLLGQALVATSRWAEAGEVMRRVLSIFPDDREAHAGLSEVYRIEKRPDDAIWHLERAFEQTPNDQTILDNLRELYRKYRKTEHGKVQLTAAAVARQYMRNGLYEQAIDTLQKARVASPERLDLPLLLAQTYWDRGQRVEAAETALEVLQVLPDCLVANTLLAAMWLTESRPSDAQRYIGRIESLDPYLALELAQGQDVPDNAFKLEELDYQRAAEREMMAGTPDWLVDVTGTGEMQQVPEDTDAVPDFFNDISVDEETMARQSFGGPLTSSDWGDTSNDLPYIADDTSPTVRKPTGPLTGLAGRFNKQQSGPLPPEPAAKPNIPSPKRGLTGRLTPLPEQTPQPEPASPDLFASFMDDVDSPPTESTAPEAAAAVYTGDLPDLASLVPDSAPPTEDLPFRRERVIQPEENDPLAWLRSTGVEIDEDAARGDDDEDQYGADADNLALQESDAADPLSWLQGYGGNELVVGQAVPQPGKGTDDLPLPEDQAGDPLAWLLSTEPAASAPVPTTAAEPTNDPLDWLSDDSLLDEAFDLESLVNNQTSLSEQSPVQADVSSTAATPEWQDTMADEKDPLDWLSSEPEPEAEPTDSFTWMEEDDPAATAAPSQADFPDWLNSSAANTEIVGGAEVASENDIDWMTDLPDLAASEAAPVEEAPKAAGSSMLNWLGKEKADIPEAPSMEQPAADVPDWLGELQIDTPSSPTPTASKVDENGFEWMSTADELPPVPSASDVPDWLSSMDIGNVSDNEPEVEPLAAEADTPNWLSSMNVDGEPEAEPLAAADAPDWLTSLEPDEPEAEPLAAADAPDWLSSMNVDDEPVAEPRATADAPDWLSSMNVDDEPEAEPLAAADAPDWLSSMQPDEPEAEPLAVADTPDWLSSMDIGEEPKAEPLAATDQPDWLSSMNVDDEPVAEPLAAADTPDWLSSMNVDDEPVAEPLATADTPDWLSSMQPDEPEAEPLAVADTPDWLSSMDIGEEPKAEPLAAADAPDWLSSMNVDEEPEAKPLAAADTPDWLTSLEPDEPQAEPVAAAVADAPDWLSSMDIGEEPEAEPLATADAPDWLSSMRSEEPEIESEPLAAADAPDWLSSMDIGEEDEAEPVAAADTPDWLSSMQPDEPETEAEPLAVADEPDWLSAMQPDDEAEPEPLAVADTPDWLSAMQPEDDQSAAEPEPLAVADAPDWLSAMQPEDDQSAAEPEPLAVADTPNWLSAMQPEDDQPETEPASAIADDTPDWLTAMQQPNEAQPVASDNWGARVPVNSMSDVLNDMQNEPVSDADQSMTDDEWTEAGELAPEMTADVPDWLTAMNDASQKPATNSQADKDYEWDEAPAEESMPAAPAPASNAPDWLNAMVPGLDVDYDAPEDEPVETEFLPTNKAASAEPTPSKESKTRPEFGWLLDIVSEESQQVTVVADKTALRRFVFSKLPTWLRKPTEQPDRSPAGESEADNVDIPPWLQ